jgi:excisionase family DNA binding protein
MERKEGPARVGGEVDRDYLRVAEAASLLHVSPKTVSRWAKEGKLPHIVTLGGHRRFPRAEIERISRDLMGEIA